MVSTSSLAKPRGRNTDKVTGSTRWLVGSPHIFGGAKGPNRESNEAERTSRQSDKTTIQLPGGSHLVDMPTNRARGDVMASLLVPPNATWRMADKLTHPQSRLSVLMSERRVITPSSH